jgi:hypothetical protein
MFGPEAPVERSIIGEAKISLGGQYFGCGMDGT